MDQYIQLPRLAMVLRKFWFDERRALFLLFGAVGAFLTIWLGIYYSFDNPHLFTTKFQVGFYFAGLFISGLLSASFLFSELRSKPRAIGYLLLPAAQLEKFICVILYGVVVYFVGYSTVFTLIDWVFVTLSNVKFERSEPVINILTIDKYENPFLDRSPSILFYLYFIVHALFLLGSIYFSKYGFFKTLIILLFLWIMFIAAPMAIVGFLPPGAWVSSTAAYEVYDFHGGIILDLPAWFTTIFYFFFSYVITFGLWAATYFRLTEKQIS